MTTETDGGPAEAAAARLPFGLLRRLPIARSLGGYGKSGLVADVAAGATVGVMLIPQGMAYAMIAGLPPVHGLYAALVPLAVYALLGSSRQLAVGPVAMVALLVADGVAPLAGGSPERYLALAALLAVLVGVIQLLMGLARGGFLVNLLSHPVLAGFTSAAAIIIGTSQLGGLTGLSVPKGSVHEMLLTAISGWQGAHGPTIAVGALAIAAGVAFRRWMPKLPAPMIVVAAGVVASWLLGLGASGVAIVGVVPGGLPAPALPSLDTVDVSALLPVALAIALVGFMESIAVAKVYASKNRYDVDPDQELRALGAANIAGALFQSFPVTGGFSRTAVNAQAGARSQISSLVSVGVIAVTLLFLTSLFYHLPKAVLAAIIVVAVAGLVDVRGARQLWRIDRRDFALMAATFVATLGLGIEEGIVVGAGLSFAVVLQQIAAPHIAVLGRLPGSQQYRNVDRNPDVDIDPGVAVLRMDASLFYGNAEAFRDAARACMTPRCAPDDVPETPGSAAGPSVEPHSLVLDAYPMNRTDSTGLHVLHELIDELRERGAQVYFAGAKGPLRDKLELGGIVDSIGAGHLHPDVWSAVQAANAREAEEPGIERERGGTEQALQRFKAATGSGI